MSNKHIHPLLIIISAPSGAGKTTLCARLLERYENMVYSVSCTTRPPRGNEVDGREYHFFSVPKFKECVDEGQFLEYAVVFGHYYGTLKEAVRRSMSDGRHVLLDIDVQGAAQIREHLGLLPADDPLKAGFVDIFIAPPSLDVLRDRLEKRGTDLGEVVERRLSEAKEEMDRAGEYRYLVVNDEVDRALEQLVGIVDKESCCHG